MICRPTGAAEAEECSQPRARLVASRPATATPPASTWALNQFTRSSARKVSCRCISLASTVDATVPDQVRRQVAEPAQREVEDAVEQGGGAADEHEPAELGQAVVLPEPRGEPPDARPEVPRVRHVAEELGGRGLVGAAGTGRSRGSSRVGGRESGVTAPHRRQPLSSGEHAR